MDSKSPLGTQKVGLLNEYYLWAYCVNPYCVKLTKQMRIDPSVPVAMQQMVEFLKSNKEQQDTLKQEFQE